MKNKLEIIVMALAGVVLSACNSGNESTAGNGNQMQQITPKMSDTGIFIYQQPSGNAVAGTPGYYYSAESLTIPTQQINMAKFTGWDFKSDLGTQTTPGAGLKITMSASNPSACEFLLTSQYYDPATNQYTPNPEHYKEGVFSITTNGHLVVINPNIPQNYFYPNSTVLPLTCSATVTAPDGKTRQIQATLEPSLAGLGANARVYFTGISQNQMSYIHLASDYVPLNVNQVSPPTDKNVYAGIVTDPNKDTTKYHLFGTYSAESGGVCEGYPVFTYNGQTGESIYIDIPKDGIPATAPVKVKWETKCQASQSNTMHTVSGAIQTINRFQYGTFEVVMKPSDVSGTNSSFYTFFGDGGIATNTDIYQSAPWGGYMPWGYTWHEIDFEFVPGTHPSDLLPQIQSDGFTAPDTDKDQIGKSVSLNSFQPGMADTYGTGAYQHHRYCPNPNDPECTNDSNFNPFDGNYHTFTFTWTPDEIRYYFDHKLVNVLPIQNIGAGSLLDGPLALQPLFSNGGIKDESGVFHPTSPQAISMNFWIPDSAGSFGGVFANNLRGNDKIYDDYKKVSWSPCVNSDGSLNCGESGAIGKEYTPEGIEIGNAPHTWDFTTLTKSYGPNSIFNDWINAPLSGFDNNVSTFVQNSVLVDSNGLHLCMMNLWDNMATWNNAAGVYTPSTGCDGKPILPVAGRNSATDFNNILLNISVKYAGAVNLAESGLAFQVTPNLNPDDESINASRATYVNNGWPNNATAANACAEGSVSGYNCAMSNGWYADPRFHYVTENGEKIQTAQYLSAVNLHQIKMDAGNVWRLVGNKQMFSTSGYTCTATFAPSSIVVVPQQTYNVTATVTCE